LSENYFQHADHFTRILSEQVNNQSIKEVNDLNKNSNSNNSEEKEKQLAKVKLFNS